MSLENNSKIEIINSNKEENIAQINNETSTKIKNLLVNLLKNKIGASILKLETKASADFSNLKIISKNFEEFSKTINFFQKKVEENIRKKEKQKKNINLKNEKNITNNNKKRTFSSNSIQISFNKRKRNKTIITEELINKVNIQKLNTVGRKNTHSNKLQLRTISNFKNINKKENGKEKSKGKEIMIESYKSHKPIKATGISNLKKYKTSLNKTSFKPGLMISSENSFVNNINNISHKKKEISSSQNNSTMSNRIKKGMNYSYDKTDGHTLSDIEEKTEKKIINDNSIARKNKFKEKDEKAYILINKNKPENKNVKKGSSINIYKKKQNIMNNKDNLNNKKELRSENLHNSNTLPTDLDLKNSKTNLYKNNTAKSISQIPQDKKELQMISVEKIVKLVDDVNQSINKILLDGSQIQFPRRSSVREGNRSFIINKNNEIKEFFNKSPENKGIEKDKTKELKDIPIPNSSKNIKENLNLKCKLNYNILSNDLITKKTSRKIKINNDISNINNLTSSTINKKKPKEKENEIKNYNSSKNANKKIIKKILLKSSNYNNKDKDKDKDKEKKFSSEKNKTNENIENCKINLLKEEKNNKITFIDSIKDNSVILYNILQFLSFKNKLCFLSINKLLSKERINLLINKREEINLILQLKENETIDDKIKNIKNNFDYNNKKDPLVKEFKLTKYCIDNLKKLNDPQYIKLFKDNQINNNKITEINIIYRILLLFLGEKAIVEISDDNLFWKKCCKYLKDKGDAKIGNFIITKSNNFCFDHQTINLIEFILIGNKNNILNGYYEKLCKTTGLIIPLIKEALEYCGIIVNNRNSNTSSKVLDNLLFNKKLITKLDNIIKNDHS